MTTEAQQFIEECRQLGVDPDPWARLERNASHHPCTLALLAESQATQNPAFDINYLASIFACFEQRSNLPLAQEVKAYCYLLDVIFELEDKRKEKAQDSS